MEGLLIYNNTNYRIFLSISNESFHFESAWLEPINQDKKIFRTHQNYLPGIYLIQCEIISDEGNVILKSSVYVHIPLGPIKIEIDNNGDFWWKISKDKLSLD